MSARRPPGSAERRAQNLNRIRDVLRSDEHPLQQLERIYGLTAAEAARRLGVSVRQYHRYKNGADMPVTVRLLVELGAMRRPRATPNIDKRIAQWTSQQR